MISTFSQKIRELIDNGSILMDSENRYRAIGWTKEKEPGKVRIADYCDFYNPSKAKIKVDYPTLDCYLKLFDDRERVLDSIRKPLLNSIVKVMRLEDIVNGATGRPFTGNQLVDFLAGAFPEKGRELKILLYNWSIGLVQGNFDIIYAEMKAYLPELVKLFGKVVRNSRAFIENVDPKIGAYDLDAGQQNENRINFHGFDIEVGTIHSAKGQTHTATLYMETFYERAKGNYESERLADQFKLKNLPANSLVTIKQATKMAYVGLSRPTHLLCVAVEKDRFEANLADIDPNKWEIIYV